MSFLEPPLHLIELMETKSWDDAMDSADSTCTMGYDNDGSTGLDIFRNGFELGLTSGGKPVYIFYNDEEDNAVFFIVTGEEQLKERIQALEAKEDNEEEEDDE